MPFENAITGPKVFEGGHADFLAQTDMLKRSPAAYRQLVEAYGHTNLFTDILESLGFVSLQNSEPHQSPFASFYYKEKDERYLTVGSVVTAQTGAGTNVVIALTAAQMFSRNGFLTSRPRVNEMLLDKNGVQWKIVAKNTTTNPHQITIRPALAATATTFVANDRFAILAPRFAEATGQPKGLVDQFGDYFNRFAIYKETQLTSGTNKTTKENWYTVPGLEGYAYQKGFADAEVRHEVNISKGLVFDRIADNLTDFSPDFDTNISDHGTEGFIQGVETQGKVQTWDVAAGYDKADFDRAEAWYRQKNLPTADIAVLQGGTVASQVQTALENYMGKEIATKYLAEKYLGQRYKSTERYTAEQLFIQLGFKGIQLGNYKFIFREISELNSMFGEGYTGGIDYSTWQFFVPLRTFKDAKQNITMNTIQLLHRGQDVGGYQRRVQMWETGGSANRIKTDQFDVHRKFLLSEVCLMMVGGQWIILQKGGTVDA